MAIVDISYICGCGVRFKTLEAAIEHVDSASHTLGVSGSIRPSVRKQKPVRVATPEDARPKPRVRRPSAAPPTQVQTGGRVDFNNLRAKLQRSKGG